MGMALCVCSGRGRADIFVDKMREYVREERKNERG